MSFPINPTNGQQATVNGIIYVYNTGLPAWSVFTNTGSNIAANNATIANQLTVGGVITAAGISISGSTTPLSVPLLSQTQINSLTPSNGDMVYNTTENLPQIYQSGTWKNFTISYYS